MENIIVCNTANDSISKVDLEKNNISTMTLNLGGERNGPRNIDIQGESAVITNCYSDSITFVDLKELKEKENYKVDRYPKDIKWREEYIYIACGDSNSILFFNERSKEVEFSVKVGDYPSSIAIDKNEKNIYVANMNSNSLSVISNKKKIKDIKLKDMPTKIMLSENERYMYTCQNSFEGNKKGYLRIYEVNTFKLIKEYNLGYFPSDIVVKEGIAYITNLGDGSVSILNLKDGNSYRIIVGGMPKGVLKIREEIIVADYYSGELIFIHESSMNKKSIAIGVEPNAMAIVNQFH